MWVFGCVCVCVRDRRNGEGRGHKQRHTARNDTNSGKGSSSKGRGESKQSVPRLSLLYVDWSQGSRLPQQHPVRLCEQKLLC